MNFRLDDFELSKNKDEIFYASNPLFTMLPFLLNKFAVNIFFF